MDNIVYGIRDRDFPNFVSKNSPKLISGSENFILDSAVAFASDNTPRIEKSSDCVNTTDEVGPVCKVTTSDEAWRYHLGEPDANPGQQQEISLEKLQQRQLFIEEKFIFQSMNQQN